MEIISLLYISLALFLIIPIFKIITTKNYRYRLPPTPAPALPFIGHLHLLTPPLHRTFRRISQTHGPIFSLKLGSRRVVVVSSPYLVEECFTKNDIVFSNRPHVLADKYIGYNHTTVAGAPYGHHWRSLRRLAAVEVLASARLNVLSELRQEEVRLTLQNLTSSKDFTVVELRPKIFQLIFNVIMRMLAGKRYFSGEIHEMVSEVFECAQSSNPEDFLPFLRWIDYRGLKKKLADLGKKLDDFYEQLLAEHRREKRNTIIGHLLSLQESEPEFYTDQTIKGFITDIFRLPRLFGFLQRPLAQLISVLRAPKSKEGYAAIGGGSPLRKITDEQNMILAGTDTSAVTIEWAMSLLLNHPDVLQNARLELDTKVKHQHLVEEQDLPNLNYLRNIILETFRMFPAGPLVMPRESSADCTVGGYDIPRGTILLVNAWAIHRDPNVWDEPTSFKPERFEGREVETEKMMPFGMGRRACPGPGLGQRMVGLTLASLIQCFDWESVPSNEVDLAEGVGLTMPKLKPLEAMCRPRQILLNSFDLIR